MELARGASLIITPVSVFATSKISLTIVATSPATFGFAVSAYIKSGSRPTFADFDQAKPVALFGGADFYQVYVGEWFVLLYNDGPDLQMINIGLNVEGMKVPKLLINFS